ncbi:FAR-17a/AIG1-like protein [Nakaseomyces glabratus]|nr:FAR-17a/AIG1-like protein [Nakaseomyces glabratus]KAH7593337.1 FAR-17a/AIG1-like protein [Nakaseomyces glabratus]
MNGNLSLAINVLCLSTSYWGYKWSTQIQLPPTLEKAGHKQFFTNISLMATMVSNVASILNWCIQRMVGPSKAREDKPFFANLSELVSRHIILPQALVLETVVPLIYWPLRLFAIKLIMQGVADGELSGPLIPISVDIAIHALPFIFIFSDHYLSGYGARFRLSNTTAWFIIVATAMSYYKFLQLIIDPTTGQTYPYPFLDVPEPYKSVIFVITATIAWIFYALYQRFPPRSLLKETIKMD